MPATLLQINYLVGWDFGRVPPTTLPFPDTWYVGLSLVTLTGIPPTMLYPYEPDPAWGYARVQLTNNKTNWTQASGGKVYNNVAVTFPASTTAWGTVRGLFLCVNQVTDPDGGKVRWYANFSTPISVPINTTLSWPANTIMISLT